MRTRQLGTGGPTISVLGFGAWAAGGPWAFGWGPQDDADSIRALHCAIDRGISWVDTAAAYGFGHSEEVMGEGLADHPDVMVFTKCGVVRDDGTSDGTRGTLEPSSIRAECEASLRRLRRETIDVYQFHWPHPDKSVALEDSWAEMLALVDEGKVRWPGLSNFDNNRLDRCEALRHVQSLQPPYSLLRRGAENDVFPWCIEHGTGVVSYSPLQSGLLTGSFSDERMRSLAPDDWRRSSSTFAEPQLSRNLAAIEALRPVAAESGLSLAVLAIGFVLSHPAVTGAIVGARSSRQVEEWVPAGDLELDSELTARLISEVGPFADRPKPRLRSWAKSRVRLLRDKIRG